MLNVNLKAFGWTMGLLSIATIVVADVAFSPDTITIDAKHWECKASVPKGIGAECIRLEKK